MSAHLPVLQIVVPLMSAPICLVLRARRAVIIWGLVVTWTAFGMAVTLLQRVLHSGTLSYALGGWAAPWGIEYRLDLLSAFVLVLVSAAGALVLTFAPASIAREIETDRHYLFVAAYLLALTGLLGIVITGDLFNLFVFLEIASLSSYALVSLGPTRRALRAAFQYLVMGTVGATFVVIGIGLVYMATGTLNMADAAARLAPLHHSRTVLVAFAFLSIGVALKMAVFPLHAWLPNAYCYAPSAVTAFLAATATKVAVYVLLRLVFTVFGERFAFAELPLDELLLPLALVGIFVASAVAILERDVKRLLAYSSIAQIGYMVLGLSFASVTGLAAGIVHMFNHALMKGGLFLAMGAVALRVGSVKIDDMQGLGRQMPVTMFAWVLGGMSLVGLPLTSGFVSKWLLVSAALQKGWWFVAVLVLASSLMALIYVWRVVEVVYFKPPPEGRRVAEAPLSLLVPTCIFAGATVLFGVWTPLSAGVALRAAQELLGIP